MGHLTTLLRTWSAGDEEARDELMALVYRELRRRAASQLRRERQGHTLQPTALVHEVYVRLAQQQRTAWQNRAQFFAVASALMRRVLVDHARSHQMKKRSGGWLRVDLVDDVATIEPPGVAVLDLDAALTRLAELDERQSRVAEMRFFGGLSLHEIADALDLSVATIERDWQTARAWLFATLSAQGDHPGGRAARNSAAAATASDRP